LLIAKRHGGSVLKLPWASSPPFNDSRIPRGNPVQSTASFAPSPGGQPAHPGPGFRHQPRQHQQRFL